MVTRRLRRPSLLLTHQAGIADNVDHHDLAFWPYMPSSSDGLILD
jgi:hypothetical protein